MQTIGAKRYFLSLAFSFRNSAKTFAIKNTHAAFAVPPAISLERIEIAESRGDAW